VKTSDVIPRTASTDSIHGLAVKITGGVGHHVVRANAFRAIAFIGLPVALKPAVKASLLDRPKVPPARLAVDHHRWPEHRGGFT